ncbi:hypothetical protein DL240_11485 [Lujinxingia litoralis]|uniref:Tetratricopeptide repeat protein n=1 Tax=Lujinxingia litoralis TaxID=2211119 RepID=A0A328C7S5_9DELT|nr:hypothetical protein [Lujinxingia litoralis]RAL22460.1 hypothetical protein DL240_11485 [Lujinxingia litoralis]
MKATRSQQDANNPLGLALDFMFGRGYLWAERQPISDWITLESLRMEIPDLKFPFDARAGLDRFRHTRAWVREAEFAISEVGLGDLLSEAAAQLEGFEELQVRFLEDAAHISLRLKAFGADSYLSFRAALIPPEPARADEVHLSLYDYRAYGPLPYPARLVAYELLTSLLNAPRLRSPGRGRSFTVGLAGDIVIFRPLKLLFLHVFPRVGWKLPNLSGVVLESARVRPGVLTIRAISEDAPAEQRREARGLVASTEGTRALASYEAKELFSHADQALFDGQVRQAIALLASYRDLYGLHPELVARQLDCLVAEPTPSHLAEAESLRRELVAVDEGDLAAALVGPNLALASGRDDARVVEAYETLSQRLRERQETRDWVLCELAIARRLASDAPERCAERLREVLRLDPRNRPALELLSQMYERLGERAGLEETLKRLTGVYSDRQTLKDTYLKLARHLMDRQGDLAESRMYLERVLRLDPGELEALHILGESYVLGGEPLRALKAFGSAARAAQAEGEHRRASRLYQRVGQIWFEELEDANQALLSFRRALGLASAEDGQFDEDRTEPLEWAGAMCEVLERDEEATGYWSELLPMRERAWEVSRGTEVEAERCQALIRTYRRLGEVYERRQRWEAAASQMRRVLELDPTDDPARHWMIDYLRQAGQPEELIGLYRALIAGADSSERRIELLQELAELYASLGLVEDAQEQLRLALREDVGRVELRATLVELLSRHRRYETLREALEELLTRTTEHRVRWELGVELGRACAQASRWRESARAYLQAVQLMPAERVSLEGAADALSQIVDAEGVAAEAPIGSHKVGRLLENVLIRLAELEASPAAQRELLLQIAVLAQERGDRAAAAEARERARALDVPEDEASAEGVDQRLDAMLDRLVEEAPEVEDEREVEPDDAPEPETGDAPPVGAFRKRFESMIKRPATLPRVDEVERESALGKILRGVQTDEDAPSAASDVPPEPTSKVEVVLPRPAGDRPPEARVRPPEASGIAQRFTLQRSEDAGAEGAAFDSAAKASSFAKDEQERVEQIDDIAPPNASDPHRMVREQAPTTSPHVHPVQLALSELEEARASDEPESLARALRAVVELTRADGGEVIGSARRLALQRELGELLYYELEDAGGARAHLEAVRDADPQGLGKTAGVVNALEAIYEEEGDVAARLRLLEARLEGAESSEMATTYRLLIAQLIWDEREDAESAREWLEQVLESDPRHEAAHRLLADMALDAQSWDVAAKHLAVVVQVAGGGIDAVETERELAELLLHRLNRPEDARTHYERVLASAPGDAMALEGVKACQAALDDWMGYVESLARELGLLLGKPGGLTIKAMMRLQPEEVAPALAVPASQIVSDAAHIVETNLERDDAAWRLWGMAFELWPEHVEALERRIALDRAMEKWADLAHDLEAYALMLLDASQRFDALAEAADLYRDRLDESAAARGLYAEALALVEGLEPAPERLDEVRRALKRLQAGGGDVSI